MTDLSNLYYRHPRLLVLTLCLILVAGLSAYQVLPRAEDPTLSGRFARVVTPFFNCLLTPMSRFSRDAPL